MRNCSSTIVLIATSDSILEPATGKEVAQLADLLRVVFDLEVGMKPKASFEVFGIKFRILPINDCLHLSRIAIAQEVVLPEVAMDEVVLSACRCLRIPIFGIGLKDPAWRDGYTDLGTRRF